jgi:methionyl-tRNA synthetase
MPKPFYITTAIDYTNGAPHLGHAYEKVLADVIARYYRLKGEKVFFLTGVDQHGQKVQQSAEKAGVVPQQFVDEITAKFIALWEKLEVRYDIWAATTDPLHKECVQGILQRLYDEKQIYKDKQEGYYSVRQEQFLTDKERGPDGEFGPEWGEVEHRVEENYYFRLAPHKNWLRGYLKSEKHQDCVTPAFRQTELINAVEKLVGDLCISRPKSRLSWGIELPFDPDYVNYVWFDALTNYISFIGYDPAKRNFSDQPEVFREKWPALHILGKDILIPAHGIYWPIMLHALGFPDDQIPKFLVHGWWNMSGTKMSKSLGNVVSPAALIEQYGAEVLRHYLMTDIVTGKDADFDEFELSMGNNSTLAGIIGNLVNRSLSMLLRYRNGQIHRVSYSSLPEGAAASQLRILTEVEAKNAPLYLGGEMARYRTDAGFLAGASLAVFCNKLIEITAPWKLAKDEGASETLDALLYSLAETIRVMAIIVSPVVPKAAHGIFDQLNWKMEPELAGKEERFSLSDAEWGKLPDGHVVGKPTPLFPRIEALPAAE